MGGGVIQSLGGSSGGGGCCCWSIRLCYTETAPEDNLYVFRENNDSGSSDGFYDPYTWDPNAPFVGSLEPIDAITHGGGTNILLWGNGAFNSTYTTFYSTLSLGFTTVGGNIRTVNYLDPTNPAVVGTVPVDVNIGRIYSLAVRPTTDVVYMCSSRPSDATQTRISTIIPSTGVSTALADLAEAIRVIGFDVSGNCYAFDALGNAYTVNIGGGIVTGIWSFAGGEYVLAFMGYAGTGYGVVTYQAGVYRNRIIDITDGTVIDTLTGVQRGVFYTPSTPPTSVTPFIRLFTDDGGVTFTNRDIITGEEITIPEGAVISECG